MLLGCSAFWALQQTPFLCSSFSFLSSPFCRGLSPLATLQSPLPQRAMESIGHLRIVQSKDGNENGTVHRQDTTATGWDGEVVLIFYYFLVPSHPSLPMPTPTLTVDGRTRPPFWDIPMVGTGWVDPMHVSFLTLSLSPCYKLPCSSAFFFFFASLWLCFFVDRRMGKMRIELIAVRRSLVFVLFLMLCLLLFALCSTCSDPFSQGKARGRSPKRQICTSVLCTLRAITWAWCSNASKKISSLDTFE